MFGLRPNIKKNNSRAHSPLFRRRSRRFVAQILHEPCLLT
jgi:hypothetical protein